MHHLNFAVVVVRWGLDLSDRFGRLTKVFLKQLSRSRDFLDSVDCEVRNQIVTSNVRLMDVLLVVRQWVHVLLFTLLPVKIGTVRCALETVVFIHQRTDKFDLVAVVEG